MSGRTCGLAVVLAALVVGVTVASAQTPAGQTLEQQMKTYAEARRFHDIGALRLLFSPFVLATTQDTMATWYRRFRAQNQTSPLDKDDLPLRTFLISLTSNKPTEKDLETFAAIFKAIEEGDGRVQAALLFFAWAHLPSSKISISESSYELARQQGSRATYYLTERWEIESQSRVVRTPVHWALLRDSVWNLALNEP